MGCTFAAHRFGIGILADACSFISVCERVRVLFYLCLLFDVKCMYVRKVCVCLWVFGFVYSSIIHLKYKKNCLIFVKIFPFLGRMLRLVGVNVYIGI